MACRSSLLIFLLHHFSHVHFVSFHYSFCCIRCQDSYRGSGIYHYFKTIAVYKALHVIWFCVISASIDVQHQLVFFVIFVIIFSIHEFYSNAKSSRFASYQVSIFLLLVAHFLQVAFSSTIITHGLRGFTSL